MKYSLFKKCVLKHLINYKIVTLGISESGKWRGNGDYKPQILPIRLKRLNLLPAVNMPEGIKEHRYIHHLNSSQMMGINFFQPLFEDSEGKRILLKLLVRELGLNVPSSSCIKERPQFEFEPCKQEGTNFDVFIELSTGEKIYIEIKYTENGFGRTHPVKASPEKYENKWNDIYSKHVEKSLYLKDISKTEFYKHYQIWRNVSYVRTEKDYAVMLIPFHNGSLTNELNRTIGLSSSHEYGNVLTVDWHSFANTALKLSRNTKYHLHFKMFFEKYLNYAII